MKTALIISISIVIGMILGAIIAPEVRDFLNLERVEAAVMVPGPQGERGEQGSMGIQGQKGDKGDPGQPGQNGKDGQDGKNGSSCTVKAVEGGAQMTCEDGSQVTIVPKIEIVWGR